MNDFTVTVIIPALNEEEYIQRCLSSLEKLNFQKELLKVVVADNGSQDKTREIAQQLSVVVIEVPRRSIGYTRNVGASEAITDLIAFIDADIVVHPDWLAEAVLNFKDEEVVAVGSYPAVLQKESNRLQQVWSNLCQNLTKEQELVDWLPSANLIVRRSAFIQIDGFNENLITCEDVDIGYRLKGFGKIINNPRVLVYHLREPKNFIEFFKKEVWHSKGNLVGIFNHRFSIAELPSIVFPGLFGAGLLACAVGLFLGKAVLSVGFSVVFILPCVYVFKGRRKAKGVGFVFCVYFVYLTARSFSFYRDLLHLFIKRKFI